METLLKFVPALSVLQLQSEDALRFRRLLDQLYSSQIAYHISSWGFVSDCARNAENMERSFIGSKRSRRNAKFEVCVTVCGGRGGCCLWLAPRFNLRSPAQSTPPKLSYIAIFILHHQPRFFHGARVYTSRLVPSDS
jgi:hypothetical protein